MKRLTEMRIDDDIRPIVKAESIRRGISIDDMFNAALRHAFKMKPYDDTEDDIKPSYKLFIDENMRKWLDENLETGTRIYSMDFFNEMRLKAKGLEKQSNKQLFVWLRYYCVKKGLTIVRGANKSGRWIIFVKSDEDYGFLDPAKNIT